MLPRVSVVMPVYNCVAYIKESVASILTQTFTDFEFFIIDDHSTDGTYEYLQTLTDARIQLIRKPQNSGYTESLNMGLDLAKGEYIARMDGDDICFLSRFKEQVDFLNAHQDIILCGTWFMLSPGGIVREFPLNNSQIKTAFLEHCAIGHPTVMFRSTLFKEAGLRYDHAMEPAEDYDLWVRILDVGKLANIPKTHLIYRVHDEQVSSVYKQMQLEKSNIIRASLLSKLYDNKPTKDIKPLFFFLENEPISKNHLKSLEEEIVILRKLNHAKSEFDKEEFELFLIKKRSLLITLFFKSSNKFSWQKLAFFLFNSKKYYSQFKNIDKLKIICNCVFCANIFYRH